MNWHVCWGLTPTNITNWTTSDTNAIIVHLTPRNFYENWFKMHITFSNTFSSKEMSLQTFLLKKMNLKMSSAMGAAMIVQVSCQEIIQIGQHIVCMPATQLGRNPGLFSSLNKALGKARPLCNLIERALWYLWYSDMIIDKSWGVPGSVVRYE